MNDVVQVTVAVGAFVIGLGSVVLTYISARAARESALSALPVAPRRPQPASAETQASTRATLRTLSFLHHFPWLPLTLAVLVTWLALTVIRPLKWLPASNPVVVARVPDMELRLTVDVQGKHLEDGDTFPLRLIVIGRRSASGACVLMHRHLIGSAAIPAADVVQARRLGTVAVDCTAEAVWLVAPKHGGRQVAAVTLSAIAEPTGAPSDIATLETNVDIGRGFGLDALFSGAVSLMVALVGLLVPKKGEQP